MCEDHGPKPRLVAVLDTTGAVALTVDREPLCVVHSAGGRLPVVTYPGGQVDCVLSPAEPIHWTARDDKIPGGAVVAFCAGGSEVALSPGTGHAGAVVLEGRSLDGGLVRLRLQPNASVVSGRGRLDRHPR